MAITLELSPGMEERLKDRARVQGLSVGRYVEMLVEEKVGKPERPTVSPAERYEALMQIVQECHALPTLDNRSADEIIGYDDYGLPT